MLKKGFDLFLFSSLYISICSVIMVYQASHLFLNDAITFTFYCFVFFSTVCSYNFHWYLSTFATPGSGRLKWAIYHKNLHWILYIVGLVGASICLLVLRQHWFWIAIGGFVTFLYSAPKIPMKPFNRLRKIAIGKTIFLAFVWMYVTTILPMVISSKPWNGAFTLFAVSRFCLIYAICILFDFRDREDDKADGIRSMITYFDERGINNIFILSLMLFGISTLLLLNCDFKLIQIIILLIPGIALAALYSYAKKNFSDYVYYFILDGLMMFSALLMMILHI